MSPFLRALSLRTTAAATAATLGLAASGCSSSTTIITNPPGARVYLNGESVGSTPYTMTDTKIVGSTTALRLEYPGYETVNAAISRNEEFSVGACIGGVFLLVPFLWIMGYKPSHTFELRPAGPGGDPWNAARPGTYPQAPGYPPAGGPAYPPPGQAQPQGQQPYGRPGVPPQQPSYPQQPSPPAQPR